MTRREFILGSAMALAAAPFAVGGQEAVPPPKAKPADIRIGIIGLGARGRLQPAKLSQFAPADRTAAGHARGGGLRIFLSGGGAYGRPVIKGRFQVTQGKPGWTRGQNAAVYGLTTIDTTLRNRVMMVASLTPRYRSNGRAKL